MATDGWGVAEWKITSTRVFRDLFKHATYWQVERARHDAGVQMETWKQYGLRPTNMSHANGYPVSLPRWWLWQNSFEVQTAVAYIGWGGASVAAGQYAVHFDGNGTLSFGGDARLAAPLSYDPVAMRGRYLFNVSAPATGVSIRIMTTDPSAPLENVRILRVQDELRSAGSGSGSAVSAITSINVDATDAALATQPFHPDLLNALNGTRLLRFCGWALIDSNDYNENNFRPAWRDRSTLASLTQAGPRGVALEYMVALANTLNASAWFCMPRSNAMDPSLMTTRPNRPGAADEADLMTYATYVDSPVLNGLTQQLNQRGIRLISDVGGPDLGAADYGARATLSGSLRCSQCLWFAMGNKYGPVEFAELSASSTLGNGYVKAEQWRQLQAYEGLDSSRRAHVALSENGSPTYWKHVGPNVSDRS